jgi:hypothetical protein
MGVKYSTFAAAKKLPPVPSAKRQTEQAHNSKSKEYRTHPSGVFSHHTDGKSFRAVAMCLKNLE